MIPARIALFGPKTPFYDYLLSGLGEAIRRLGHQCIWSACDLPREALAEWAKREQPNLVLEINRVLPRASAWPDGVAHACWLQDYRFDGADLTGDLGKSDHIYLLIHPDAFGMPIPADRRWSFLLPGARSDVPLPDGPPQRCDFSLCGFMPPPVADAVVATTGDGKRILLSQFLKEFPQAELSQSQCSIAAIRRLIDEISVRQGWRLLDDQRLLIDEFTVRTLDRLAVLRGLLKVSRGLELWGPRTWSAWPEFAPYYRGELAPLSLDKEVYQATRQNVHNSGLAMHFRVIDCMAASTFVLVNETAHDFKAGGIRQFFSPDIHYGGYAIKDIDQVARRYLQDEPSRLRIAEEGRRAVLAGHTWDHRAAQIIRDFDL